jgi:hypothetical protein
VNESRELLLYVSTLRLVVARVSFLIDDLSSAPRSKGQKTGLA